MCYRYGRVFDSHCHLDVPAFDGDRAEVIARARAAGIDAILVPAIRPATFAALAQLRGDRHGVAIAIAIGVHPQVVNELAPAEAALATDADAIAEAAQAANAVAIGECGLDGATGNLALQERILRAHVRAARAARLPLVLHVLRAHDAAPRILAEEHAGEVGGVMHSYSGGVELVGKYRDLGFAFSLAGPVTFANARRPLEAARAIPADLLLAETDAPDQSPARHRGTRNEPAYLPDIITALATARGEDVAAVAARTAANARRIFRL